MKDFLGIVLMSLVMTCSFSNSSYSEERTSDDPCDIFPKGKIFCESYDGYSYINCVIVTKAEKDTKKKSDLVLCKVTVQACSSEGVVADNATKVEINGLALLTQYTNKDVLDQQIEQHNESVKK